MKHVRIVTCAAGLAVGLAAGGAWGEAPLSTAFTYQGQLKQAGVPLNATADFQFSLWDAAGSGDPPSGGNQIGSTVRVGNIAVTNGLFNVEPDFGAAAMMVERRWLQIGVRSPAWDGQGDEPLFTTLNPRQALTAAPYAVVGLEPGARTASVYAAEFLGGSVIEDCQNLGDIAPCQQVTAFTVSVPEGEMLMVNANFETGPDANLWIQRLPRADTAGPGFFDIHVQTWYYDLNMFTVAPDRPVYDSQYDPIFTGDLTVRASLITNGLVQFVIRTPEDGSARIDVIRTGERGDISDAYVEPYPADARMAQLRATIRNASYILSSGYVVTVTDCPSHIAPVVAQTVYVARQAYTTLEFTLRTDAPLTGDEECLVTLMSPMGRTFGDQIVDFPPPTEAARAPAANHAPEAKVNLPPTARQNEGDGPHRKPVDVINAKSSEIADLNTRLDNLETLVNQLRATRKDGER